MTKCSVFINDVLVNLSLTNRLINRKKVGRAILLYCIFSTLVFAIETVSCFFLASIKSVLSYLNPKMHQMLISLFVTDRDQFIL